jgi:hypothetical protein
MALAACSRILLGFSGKEQSTNIFHQSLGIQPAINKIYGYYSKSK